MADGPPPYTGDEPQQLLQDARAIRDIFAQEKTQVENLLNLALEKVKLYRTLLSITEAKLCSVEDLIGDIRSRFRQRGIPIPANVTTSRSQAVDETVTGERSSENGCPPGMYNILQHNLFVLMAL